MAKVLPTDGSGHHRPVSPLPALPPQRACQFQLIVTNRIPFNHPSRGGTMGIHTKRAASITIADVVGTLTTGCGELGEGIAEPADR